MKNKLFNMFSTKPVTKENESGEIPTGFVGFFKMFIRKFWNISNLSLVYCLCNLPIFALLIGYGLRDTVTVVKSPMFSAFYGISTVSQSAEVNSLFSFVSSFGKATVNSTGTYICLAIAALFFITFGLSNVGQAYIVRGYCRGEPIFLMSDFFDAVKKNWKQGIVLGLLDIVFSAVLIFDFLFWYSSPGFINGVLMYFALFLCVVYFFMRFYMYTIAITFDLAVFKILKNSFLFAFLGFKRNFTALIGLILTLALSLQIFLWLPSLGIMLPIVLTIGLLLFISGYASYPVIKKYMITPYYPDADFIGGSDDDEPLFEDRG